MRRLDLLASTEKGSYHGKEEDEEEEENIPLPGRNSGKIDAAPSSLSEQEDEMMGE